MSEERWIPAVRREDGSPEPRAIEAAVRALRDGQVVGLPTETVYGLAVACGEPVPSSLTDPRIVSLKGGSRSEPLSVAVHDRESAERIAPLVPSGARRLAKRFWPGPLTLVLDRPGDTAVGLRVPADKVARAVLEAFGAPVFLTSANRSGRPAATTAQDVAAIFGPQELPCLLDAGPSPVGQASTVVRFEGPRAVVLREGLIDAAMVRRVAATKVLMVCTGNTCRSPMAEALFRQHWARALGIESKDLLEHGGLVTSAGVAAFPGIRASMEAVQVLDARGIDLRGHRSSSVEVASVLAADRIYAMTRSHLQTLVDRFPQIDTPEGPHAELLDPEGQDVPDPIGGGEEEYRRCADRIERAVERRVHELLSAQR